MNKLDSKKTIKIVGGGLAGTECALQLLKAGFSVQLYEMRPHTKTGAHDTDMLAELVCSNSLKSEENSTASGVLKAELDLLGSELLALARQARVPSGSALAVDRKAFSELVECKLRSYDNFELIRQEIKSIDEIVTAGDDIVVVATGPLTSPDMARCLQDLTDKDRLFFYDAIAPIVSFDSVDMQSAYFGGRYGKGGDDYLNLPMQRDEYELFYSELVTADTVVLKDFEKKELFSSCMPIEEMAKRGSDTIRFGPLKPVGLRHPVTGEKAYAVVQLRKENVLGDCFNLVGFQTNLTYGEQKRVFSLILALKNAEFLRYGVMHRNTYINAPYVLDKTFKLKVYDRANVYIAGQLSGVEGYVESIMSGLVAGLQIARELLGKKCLEFSHHTITGSLINYITSQKIDFQPMNSNFGLLEGLDIRDKKQRKLAYFERAVCEMKKTIGLV